MELVSFGGISATKLIPALWKKLGRIRSAKASELEEINKIIYGDPLDIARFYVEPDCQEVNPADQLSEDFFFSREPVMKKISEFFKMTSSSPGDNQLFVLSDAGMGKTALLTMLKLMHLTAFWPKGHDCVLLRLGPDTLTEIRKIPNKSTTILLLDSLDEDPEAYGKVHERLMSVMNETQHFFKTILTCRTQFFPRTEEDPFKRQGMVEIDGYVSPVKYLSFFDQEKVIEYCEKRFPKKWGLFMDHEKIAEAHQVVCKMGALQCRPMLLAYIDDLMASPLPKENDSEYQVYNALVASWLKREKKKDPSINTKELLDACLVLAVEMQTRNVRSISEDELGRLISGKVKPVQNLQLTGRSLLNRNSKGDYRFSHYSIQEFCVAKLLLDEPIFKPNIEAKIHVTDFIFRMIALSKKPPNFVNQLDFKDVKANNTDLREIKLPGADLKGIDFSSSDLRGADFSRADLSGADLANIDLRETNLNETVLISANLKGSIRYRLRSTPLTVSYDEFRTVFKLDGNNRPLEYTQNDYEDNGDGTVTDHATGLIWQKSGSDERMLYKDAIAFVGKINRERFAGFNDWRLPTIEELATLLENEKKNGDLYIDPIFDRKQRWCWSSDKRAGGGVWLVLFYSGFVDRYNESIGSYVRLVRRGQ